MIFSSINKIKIKQNNIHIIYVFEFIEMNYILHKLKPTIDI